MLQKSLRKTISLASALAIVCTGIAAPWSTDSVEAAQKASLKAKKVTVKVGKTKKIAIKGKAKKAKYTFKSNKTKVATVNKSRQQ